MRGEWHAGVSGDTAGESLESRGLIRASDEKRPSASRFGIWYTVRMEKSLTQKQIIAFQKIVYTHFKQHSRKLPWRPPAITVRKDGSVNPYKILVSEVMLQQTQVSRVIIKYKEFIEAFPNFLKLAEASFREVLKVWQGMGYNRRALALHKLARVVIEEYEGALPQSIDALVRLPGIGRHTASSIRAFAFNKPSVFIETNIRSVYIYHFFSGQKKIRDAELLPLIEQTLDTRNPRMWYAALMDYGAMLKKDHGNPSRNSAHYVRQSRFEGSNREARGRILRILVAEKKSFTLSALARTTGLSKERLKISLAQLIAERMIIIVRGRYAMSAF